MKRLSCCTILLIWTGTLAAEEYRGIFWNLHSGDSDDETLAKQMADKGPEIDFWGLSEVSGKNALDTFEKALEDAHGVDYVTKLSRDGNSDRLAILYRSDRLQAIPYSGDARVEDIGDDFFEVNSIRLSGGLRPALGIQLQGKDRQPVVILVQHWKCCGGDADVAKRLRQARALNAFAVETPGIPLISGGDHNIAINRGGRRRGPFRELVRLWDYEETQPDVGSFRSGSVLDSVFVTNRVGGWDTRAVVLSREGRAAPAGTERFADTRKTTDHRPLLLIVESDVEERRDALREEIEIMEASLARLRAALAQLEGE